MNTFIRFGLILLSILLGCATEYPVVRDPPRLRAEIVPEIQYPMVRDSGAYYAYNFTDYRSSIINPDTLLIRLYQIGCPVTTGWFHPGSGSGCHPPNSKLWTKTMVMPYFVVRLDQQDSKMSRYNFSYLGKNQGIKCVYSVRVITIVQ